MSEINQRQSEQGIEKYFFRASAIDFKKIPGSPIAYWMSSTFIKLFLARPMMDDVPSFQGLATTENARFLRQWFEVNHRSSGFGMSREEAKASLLKWFPYNKGGDLRKWYGNQEYLVNWFNDGKEIIETAKKKYPYLKGNVSFVVKEGNPYFQPCMSWTDLTSKGLSCRYYPKGFLFDVSGHSAFPDLKSHEGKAVLCFMNTRLANEVSRVLNPSMHFQVGDFRRMPRLINSGNEIFSKIFDLTVSLSKEDWDSYETSWDFSNLPLLDAAYSLPTLKAAYQELRIHWRGITFKMQSLEKENNHIFIVENGLQGEMISDVPLKDITLTCNPHYRYGSDKTEEELEALLLADTMREFISYAVGCMFGRYSLDKPGLILANQGETIEDYLRQIPQPTFMPDTDNVIPILDGDWFTDDIAERFRKFLRTTFGDEHYQENLQFIENALGKKGKPQSIRDYFLKDFYTDHVKRYKKRPIYWMFSSPKGTFNALVYLHRYRPDTVSIVLNDYLREFRTKLAARKGHLDMVSINKDASAGDKTKALKEIEVLKKQLVELDDYEREVLYPLATRQLAIDLDDGVKHNYVLFGPALKKIVGLDASDE